MPTYITAGDPTGIGTGTYPLACPSCKNAYYMRVLPNGGAHLNTQTNANVQAVPNGVILHCDNCQHNFSSSNEF